VRYRRSFGIEAWSFDIDAERYRRNIDIEVQNFKFDISIVIPDIENLSISTNASSISLYNIEAFALSNFVFFDIDVSLSDPAWAAVAPTRYWTQIVVCTLHCESIIARGSCAARAAQAARAARPHPTHRQQHRPRPPEQRSVAGAAAASTGRRSV
jgi:hypothetical protein